jgi:hypothetical protein
MKTKQEFISFISNNAGLLESPLTNDQLMKMKLDELKPLAIEIQSKIGDDDADDEITTTSSIEKVAVKPAERLQGVEYKIIPTETTNGIVDIAVAMLPFKKLTLSNGKLRFQFRFGQHIVSFTNIALLNIFENEYDNNFNDFNTAFKDMLFPIVEETITPMQERGRSYTKTFNGRILESACEIVQEGRELQQQKDYQKLINDKKANDKAENIVKVISKLNKTDKATALSGLFNMLNDL